MAKNMMQREKFISKIIFYISISMLVIIGAIVIIGPLIYNQDPNFVNLLEMNEAPSKIHLLGTDDLGRDVFVRLINGGRVSLAIGLLVTFMQLAIGVTLGMISGYFGGIIDQICVKISELIQCFPFFILAIALSSIVGGGFVSVVIILGIIGWPSAFFIIRSETIKLRKMEFILASKTLGSSNIGILKRHIYPNIKNLIIIQVTLATSSAILSESSLSFLGMGIMPPQSSWGNLLANARNMSILVNEKWQWLPAGIMIFIVVFAINLVGNYLNE